MKATQLSSEIYNTFSTVEKMFSAMSGNSINQVPFKDSWTAAQLIQHIILSGSGFQQMMYDKTGDSKPEPEGLKEKIKNDFLDFTTKMKSPDFVVPSQKEYKKDELLKTLSDLRLSFTQAVNTLDLAKTCISFALPVYGFLSRAEAAYFVLYHTQRHLHQLKNINDKLHISHAAQKVSP